MACKVAVKSLINITFKMFYTKAHGKILCLDTVAAVKEHTVGISCTVADGKHGCTCRKISA